MRTESECEYISALQSKSDVLNQIPKGKNPSVEMLKVEATQHKLNQGDMGYVDTIQTESVGDPDFTTIQSVSRFE